MAPERVERLRIVRLVVPNLPPQQRAICHMLSQGRAEKDIRRTLRLRADDYAAEIESIAGTLLDAGLKPNLPNKTPEEKEEPIA